MPCWTTRERRDLTAMLERGCPSRAALESAFPRHSVESILTFARQLGFRRGRSALFWLRKAHLYFARREQGRLV